MSIAAMSSTDMSFSMGMHESSPPTTDCGCCHRASFSASFAFTSASLARRSCTRQEKNIAILAFITRTRENKSVYLEFERKYSDGSGSLHQTLLDSCFLCLAFFFRSFLVLLTGGCPARVGHRARAVFLDLLFLLMLHLLFAMLLHGFPMQLVLLHLLRLLMLFFVASFFSLGRDTHLLISRRWSPWWYRSATKNKGINVE